MKNIFKTLRGNSSIVISNTLSLIIVLLILIHVNGELSYDKHIDNYHNKYRLNMGVKAITPKAITTECDNNFPEVLKTVRVSARAYYNKSQIYLNKEFIDRCGVIKTGNSFFDMFSVSFLYGDKANAFSKPNSVVITMSIADKLFPKTNPLSKVIIIDEVEYMISAVISEMPNNSHLNVNYIIQHDEGNSLDYSDISYYSYLELRNNTNVSEFEKKLNEYFIEKEEKFKVNPIHLMPIADIHLYSKLQYDLETNRDINSLLIIGLIGTLILLVSCVNQLSLTTSRSILYAREVSLKKIYGAPYYKLVLNNFRNIVFINGLSIIFAMLITFMLLPVFNNLLETDFNSSQMFAPIFFIGLITLLVTMSIVTGIYPAFHIALYKPMLAFRGVFSKSKHALLLRKIVVAFQFVITICLIVFTLTVIKQNSLLYKADYGYDDNNVIFVELTQEVIRKYDVFKNKLYASGIVESITASLGYPGEILLKQSYILEDETYIKAYSLVTNDSSIISIFDLDIIEGRNFNMSESDIYFGYIVNKTFAKQIDDGESIIGRRLRVNTNNKFGSIIGVVEDFHFRSLHNKIEPLAIYCYPHLFKEMNMLIKTINVEGNYSKIGDIYRSVYDDDNYSILSGYTKEAFEIAYRKEGIIQNVISVLSLLSIFITLIGLVAIANFSLEQRMKEMVIRKLMGAELIELFTLILKEYLPILVASFLIAGIISFYSVEKWLQNYAVRIDHAFSWYLFAFIITMFLITIILLYQLNKIRKTEPIEILHYE
ncbi:MAG: ABC transporter permease [Bacteroidetes bacterium]|nr:ABC transporter permease [Bacteroidota bacterium]